MAADIPRLDGVHHLKLPVRDLARSEEWYGRVLGYRRSTQFVEDGRLMGIGMVHPNGGPGLALRLDPQKAEAAAGFDYFSIGVPSEAALRSLAVRLDALGERHGGILRGSHGWLLPYLHDPDGHEVRFYTSEEHTAHDQSQVMRVEGSRESLEQAERTSSQGRAGLEKEREP